MNTPPRTSSPWTAMFWATVILVALLVSRAAGAAPITDPALVCAAARTGDGAWLDIAGLRRCLTAERLREVDAKEIQSLRDALRRESDARHIAETKALEVVHWRWYYLGGGVSAGVLLTVLIAAAAS